VNQGIRVQHLKRAPEFLNTIGQFAGNHPCGFHAQDGAQALATGKNAVAHRLVDGFRPLCWRGQESFQSLINGLLALLKDVCKHEA
jgi:hypothetical protein